MMDIEPKKVPFVLLWDKMPIDISFLWEDEKPAGRHGYLRAEGEKLVFEDGTEVKFWGTNFNSGANFPEHSHAEKVARRLAQTGVNLVRLHQLDAEWSCPNIFQYAKGKLLTNTRSLDPTSMDRLDYLVHCLKEEGIYIYMDFMTYRRFKSGDGVENAFPLRESAKPYSNFDERMIELQKEFIEQFLTHKNPYTGLTYADEPAIVMAEITNECDLFTDVQMQKFNDEPYRSRLIEKYEAWAKENGKTITDYDFENKNPVTNEFCCYLQMKYYREMYDFIREKGGKFLITGTNWPKGKLIPYCNREMDFTDSHAYWWWGGIVEGQTFQYRPHIKADETLSVFNAYNSMQGKPLVCSEWDCQWPNRYRADSTLMVAAHGALQGWNGFTIHTYRYGTSEDPAITSKIYRLKVYGNSDYRGSFDIYNDPAKWGLFYHAALILRRGDVSEGKETVVFGMDRETMMNTDSRNAYDRVQGKLCEKHRVRFAYDAPSSGDATFSDKEVLSDTGEIYRNQEMGVGYIDSPRTKAVYGFTGQMGKTELSGMSIDVKNHFGTVAVSSLTDDPITESPNLLITAVGKVENTGDAFSEDGTVFLKAGTAPVMAEVIEADIEIRTEKRNMRVWSVDEEGFYKGEMPTTYEDGVLRFTLGANKNASVYYLVQEQ